MYRTLLFTLFHSSDAKKENHDLMTYKILILKYGPLLSWTPGTLYITVGSWRKIRNNVEYAAPIASCCQEPTQWLKEKFVSLVPCQHKIP